MPPEMGFNIAAGRQLWPHSVYITQTNIVYAGDTEWIWFSFWKMGFWKVPRFSYSSLPELQKDWGGMKQAQLEKGNSCFLDSHFSLFGTSLFDTSRWWELGWDQGLRRPNVCSSLWSLVLLVSTSSLETQHSWHIYSWAKPPRQWPSPFHL